MGDDISRMHEARGDVKCEACGCWTAEYFVTLDECDLCPACAEQAPRMTDNEVRRFYGEPHVLDNDEDASQGGVR